MAKATKTLHVETRPDRVAVVRIDVPGESANSLRADFAEEFTDCLSKLRDGDGVDAVVLTSGKPGTFIVGADINMLSAVRTADDGAAISRAGQEANDLLESFELPVVAAIDGPCLGGGLEVALACRARVATDSSATRLGLPEVQLGLLPGAGGTQRLPRTIGVQAALDLMLTGRHVDGRRAKKLGLVDDVVPEAILVEVAGRHALRLAKEGSEKTRPEGRRLADWFGKEEIQEFALADNPVGRKVLFDQARKKLLAKTKGNYPAPERILDVVRVGLAKGIAAGLEEERRAFGELSVSPESAQLLSIFRATQALKKDSGVKDQTVEPGPVNKVGVLGAGLMGAGIAYVTVANAGAAVRLKDRDYEGALGGMAYVRRLVDKRVKRRRLTRAEADRQMSLVTATIDYRGFRDCDIVIEAVFEDLELKHRVLAEVEAVVHERAIFASNTSSIPISRIAERSARPDRVIGMHYFSPVEKMPLLEIITTDQTSPEVTAACVALGKRQGKTVIVVSDGVGFYTSRILAPFLNEAAFVLAEGVPIDVIDEALTDAGFPVGPIKLTDEVGIDVGEKVGRILRDEFGERLAPPEGTARLLADGRKGRKSGRGFYSYDGDDKNARRVDDTVYAVLGVQPTKTMDAAEIVERCMLQMVNEAARCLGEGVLRSPRDGDVGAVFGLGFPPFLGGPFRYADALGVTNVVQKLERFRDRLAPRFEPAPILLDMAKDERRFYQSEEVSPALAKATRPGARRASAKP